jgi:hypothetical protein
MTLDVLCIEKFGVWNSGRDQREFVGRRGGLYCGYSTVRSEADLCQCLRNHRVAHLALHSSGQSRLRHGTTFPRSAILGAVSTSLDLRHATKLPAQARTLFPALCPVTPPGLRSSLYQYLAALPRALLLSFKASMPTCLVSRSLL